MNEMTADTGTETAARAEDLHREYGRGGSAVRALRGVSVALAPGTFTAVMGPSGSGKTTLLHCLAGMDRPTRGSVWWGGTEVSRLPERRLAQLRRSRVGFVFQAFNLMPAMTVAQNVELYPSRSAWTCGSGRTKRSNAPSTSVPPNCSRMSPSTAAPARPNSWRAWPGGGSG
jgi:putative ABC transport system ATP-binding protein